MQTLTLPFFRKQDLKQVSKCSSIYRNGGIRMEHSLKESKHIYHSYGAGQATLSLAYGIGYLNAKCISIHSEGISPIAVLGLNAESLLTAIDLVKRGYPTTLYHSKEKKAQSWRVWLPVHYDWNGDVLRHQLLSKLSYQFYEDCLLNHRYQSIKKITVYDSMKVEDMREAICNYVTNVEEAQLKILGQQRLFSVVKGFAINTPLFLEELKTQAILRGVKIVAEEGISLKHLQRYSQNNIVNCLGEIAQDQLNQVKEMVIMEYKEKAEGRNYALKFNQNLEIICLEDRVVVKMLNKNNNLQRVVEKIEKLVKDQTPKPKL